MDDAATNGAADRGSAGPSKLTTLPIDKVRFVGDPVVCIVATDRYLAEDAAELVTIDYEELPPVCEMARALAPGAALVDDSLPSNLVSHQSFVAGDPIASLRRGASRRRGRRSISTARPTRRSRRAAAARFGTRAGGISPMHVGNQVPHPYRTQLARRLRLSESQVTVISPDIGGGFGQKIALYREELTVAALARALRRPVRWREDRSENLLAVEPCARGRRAYARGRRSRRPHPARSSWRSSRTSAPIASIRRTTSRAWWR